MKVKNDQSIKFSNLSNRKEEAWTILFKLENLLHWSFFTFICIIFTEMFDINICNVFIGVDDSDSFILFIEVYVIIKFCILFIEMYNIIVCNILFNKMYDIDIWIYSQVYWKWSKSVAWKVLSHNWGAELLFLKGCYSTSNNFVHICPFNFFLSSGYTFWQ